jgi:hypothetical protein
MQEKLAKNVSWLIPLNQCGLRLSEAKECILEKAAF